MTARNGVPARPARRPLAARFRWRMLGKFGASSLISTGLSQAVFALVYYLHGAPTVASVSAFVAGAIPNYFLNRFWTWKRRDRIRGVRELLPYATVVVGTALLAIAVTNVTDHLVAPVGSHLVRTAVVTGSYLGTYAVMFGVKFVLLDRLIFGPTARLNRPAASAAPPSGDADPAGPTSPA